jgi:hypothetical protein
MGKEERLARKKARQEAKDRRKEALAEARNQRAIKATARKSRALGFIQIAWVVEAMILIPWSMIYIVVLPPVKLELITRVIVPLIGAVAGQGIAAFAGPNVKKWLQGKFGKPEETPADSP